MSSAPYDPLQIIEGLKKGVLPSTDTIISLCETAKELLSKEENIISLSTPITVSLWYFHLFFRYAVIFMANSMTFYLY